jgi:hypothetical protein
MEDKQGESSRCGEERIGPTPGPSLYGGEHILRDGNITTNKILKTTIITN